MAVQADTPDDAERITMALLDGQPYPRLLINYSIVRGKTVKLTPTVRQRSLIRQINKEQVITLCREALRNVLHRTDLRKVHEHLVPLVVRLLLYHHELPFADIQVYNLQAHSLTLPDPADLKEGRWWLVTVEYDYVADLEKYLPEMITSLENHVPAFAKEGVLIGGKAVRHYGSSRNPAFWEYLIHSSVFPPGMTKLTPQNRVFNAKGDPFLMALWENTPAPMIGGIAGEPTLSGSLIYTFLTAYKARDLMWADEIEHDLKFWLRMIRQQAEKSQENTTGSLLSPSILDLLGEADRQLILKLIGGIRGL